jgi:hydrogenase maturation protease
MKKAVIGVGNIMMKDDGIGPLLISKLGEMDRFPSDIDLLDEGVGGMRIIHDIEGYDRILIIDAADFGGSPGDYKLFRPEDVETVKHISGRSLHEMDLIKTIELARVMGGAPEDIIIMAIQPEIVEMGEGISDSLHNRINDYIQAFISIIK